MPSSYPSSLDNQSTAHSDVTSEVIHAATVNDLADAVNKIEAELGVLPKSADATVRARLDKLETLSFNSQSGASYTLVLTDATKCVVMTNASPTTLTIPPAASVNFAAGTEIRVRQGSTAGAVTVTGGVGVTLINPYSSFTTAGTGAEVKLLKIGSDAWSLNGEVTV